MRYKKCALKIKGVKTEKEEGKEIKPRRKVLKLLLNYFF